MDVLFVSVRMSRSKALLRYCVKSMSSPSQSGVDLMSTLQMKTRISVKGQGSSTTIYNDQF